MEKIPIFVRKMPNLNRENGITTLTVITAF
jgi:hypothetical protein